MPDNLFGHVMRREKLERLVTAGAIEGKHIRVKTARKDVGWTNKVDWFDSSDQCTESDKRSRSVEGHLTG